MNDPYDRPAVLSNGGTVNLKVAAFLWERMGRMMFAPKHKAYLLELRDRAIDGTAFEPGDARKAIDNLGFLDQEGRLTPDAKSVVLSGLTGDLENVHLVSPFYRWKDRIMAEFAMMANTIQMSWSEEEVIEILNSTIHKKFMIRWQKPPGFSRN